MLKVTKFGGSSLCDSAGFSRVREIVLADPARRVVVVSAAGRRHAADHKITDLLYLCHAHLQYGVSCWDLWRRIADRYREIRDGCALTLPIEAELEAIYAAMDRRTPRDWIVSRGEYLSARLMADLLGFDFVDAKDWLLFDAAGRVRPAASYAALGSLADGRKIVTPAGRPDPYAPARRLRCDRCAGRGGAARGSVRKLDGCAGRAGGRSRARAAPGAGGAAAL
mgnify:CR=1 FL=1